MHAAARWLALSWIVAACGAAPGSDGSAKLTPPPPEAPLPSFVRTAPKGTRLLARLPGDKLAMLLERDNAAPLRAVLTKCGIDPRRDVERVELALAAPLGVRADVHGRVSAEAATCLVVELLGEEDAEGIAAKDVTGGVRVATAAALEDGPGAPAELAQAIAEAPEAGAVIAAQLDDHAAASLVVVHWNDTVEVRARLARGGAEAVEAWWKRAIAKVGSRALERLEVRASGGDLYVRMAARESVLGTVALAMGLRRRVLEAFKIPSATMAPTFLVGDHVFVDKTSTEFERGGATTFRFPENEKQTFIKRVIGMAGETIEVLDGRPIINGWLVPQCHVGRLPIVDHEPEQEVYLEMLGEHAYLTAYDEKPTATVCRSDRDCSDGRVCRAGHCGHLQGPFTVRAGEAFVLGDNRNNSHDSRAWFAGRGGGVPSANVIGNPRLIWASFGPDGLRWERMLVATDAPRAPEASAALAACLAKKQPAQPPKTKR